MDLATEVITFISGSKGMGLERNLKGLSDLSVEVSSQRETTDPDGHELKEQQWKLIPYTKDGKVVSGVFHVDSMNVSDHSWYVDFKDKDILKLSDDESHVFLFAEVTDEASYTIEWYDKSTDKGKGLYLTMESATANSNVQFSALESGTPPKQKWIFAQILGGE